MRRIFSVILVIMLALSFAAYKNRDSLIIMNSFHPLPAA